MTWDMPISHLRAGSRPLTDKHLMTIYLAMTELQSKLTLASNGRVVIPAAMRAALGLRDGDRIVARVVEGAIVLEPLDAAIRRARAMVARYVPPGSALVDELIAERRIAATRE
jgi:AbrB family looped-hinge helix DNA binding protein